MINTIGKFLNAALPASIAVGGLGKIDPRFKKFFYSAGLAGYGTDAALDYLRNQFEGEGQKQETNRLQERQESGNARPDELQALRTTEQNARIPNAIQKGVSVGAGLAGGLAGLGASAAGAAAEQIKPENPQQPNPTQSQPSSALSGAAMEEDVEAQNVPKEPSLEKLEADFPQLRKTTEEALQQGISPEDIYKKLQGSRLYKSLVDKFERGSGMSYLDKIYEIMNVLGSQQTQNPQQIQGQQAQGNDRIQKMQQVTEALRSLKR